MKIKVLYYISYPQRLAGSQRQIINLLCNLDESRFEAIVCLPFPGIIQEYLEARDIRVVIIEPTGILRSYGKKTLKNSAIRNLVTGTGSYIRYSKRIGDFIRSEAISILHCGEVRATLMAGLGGRLSGCKVIAHVQGEVPFKGYLSQLFRALPHRLICNADFVLKSIYGRKSPLKAQTVYSGIEDPKANAPLDSNWIAGQKSKGVVVIGCFASVVPFKGYHILIEALRIVKQQNDSLPFMVLGLGDFAETYSWYKDYIFEKINEYNIDNLTMTGWQGDPIAFLEICDLTCLPSISAGSLRHRGVTHTIKGNEGFPTTHLEAMMLGKPVIGTRISGVPEQVLHGITGLLVEPGNAQELAEAIVSLVEDRLLREHYSSNALASVAERFSIASYVSKVESTYTEMLS